MQTSLLSLFPVVSLYPVIIDPNYFLQGIIAYLFFLLFFVGYRSFSDSWGRHLAGLFMGSVLYLIADKKEYEEQVCNNPLQKIVGVDNNRI
jgi:membrane associated rhomboid family serine protease